MRKLSLISIRWQVVEKDNLELIFVIFWVRSACEIRANKTKRIRVLDVDNYYVLSQSFRFLLDLNTTKQKVLQHIC